LCERLSRWIISQSYVNNDSRRLLRISATRSVGGFVPSAARTGVGTALVKEIERVAIEGGVKRLHLEASVNAEPFYLAMGYEVVERGEHVLNSGQPMACVRMVKDLRDPPSTSA
jgi:GNAT superfamily N-acetyltransferase